MQEVKKINIGGEDIFVSQEGITSHIDYDNNITGISIGTTGGQFANSIIIGTGRTPSINIDSHQTYITSDYGNIGIGTTCSSSPSGSISIGTNIKPNILINNRSIYLNASASIGIGTDTEREGILIGTGYTPNISIKGGVIFIAGNRGIGIGTTAENVYDGAIVIGNDEIKGKGTITILDKAVFIGTYNVIECLKELYAK